MLIKYENPFRDLRAPTTLSHIVGVRRVRSVSGGEPWSAHESHHDPADGNRLTRERDLLSPPKPDDLVSYTWDARNRLTGVEDFSWNAATTSFVETESIAYTYDVLDHLIERIDDVIGTGTTTTQYVWDGDNMVLSFDNGVLAARYLNGPNTSAYDQYYSTLAEENVGTGSTTWDVLDNQGSVRDVIDSSGVVQDHLSYNSFGQVAYESAPTVAHIDGYAGGLYDASTQLVYFIHRWYDPTATVWISADPSGFAAGDPNLTRYVGNDPTSLVDPSGLEPPDSEFYRRLNLYNTHTPTETELRRNQFYQGQEVAVGGVTEDAYDAMMLGVMSESEYNSRAWTKQQGQIAYMYTYMEDSLENSRLLAKFGRAQYACANFKNSGMSEPEALARAGYFFVSDIVGVADLSQWWEEDDPLNAEKIELTERQFLGLGGAISVAGTATMLSGPAMGMADATLTRLEGGALGEVDRVLLARLMRGVDIQVPAGTRGIRQLMSDLTIVSRNEVALLRMPNGMRILRMGQPNSVSPIGCQRVIAHTHPRGSMRFSKADISVLRRLGQRSSVLIDPQSGMAIRIPVPRSAP